MVNALSYVNSCAECLLGSWPAISQRGAVGQQATRCIVLGKIGNIQDSKKECLDWNRTSRFGN